MINLPQQLPEAQRQRPHFVLLGQQAVVEFGQKVVVLCFPYNGDQPVKPLEDAVGKPCTGENNGDQDQRNAQRHRKLRAVQHIGDLIVGRQRNKAQPLGRRLRSGDKIPASRQRLNGVSFLGLLQIGQHFIRHQAALIQKLVV